MEKIRDMKYLTSGTREVSEQTTRDMLQRVWKVVEHRLDLCRVTNGAHVET
jgi:hypothetical protein